MAVSAATNDCYQVVIRGRLEEQETNNVLHFRCITPDSDVELNLIKALINCITLHLLPVLSSSWTFRDVKWKKVSPILGLEHVTLPTGANEGANTTDCSPSFVSALFSIRTLLGGKSGRGRMYLPGVPDEASIGSRLDGDGPFWLALIAFAACVVSAFVENGEPLGSKQWHLCVYSRKLGGKVLPYTLPGFHDVASFTPDQMLATTRSRKVGRGI